VAQYGLWRADHARLTITLGPDQPFIPRYFDARQPTGRRRKTFPADQRELVIATAWRLVEEGQSALVFCPERRSVEPYAREIIKLHGQGLVSSVLPPDVDLTDALAVGAEWFGASHPILRCLQLGVAIHHGALPGPFRREVERLLQLGSLQVTIASPTLAQGLNLSASAVLFHGLRRGRDLLKGSEFANVIGRAGRAFVDTEGLVLYPIFQPTQARRQEWLQLTRGDGGKALRSGLIEVGIALLRRMSASAGFRSVEPFLDYLTGGPDWSLPIVSRESTGAAFDSAAGMRQWISNLDPELAFSQDWPTPESRSAWEAFAYRAQTRRSRQWIRRAEDVDDVTWYDAVPEPDTWLRVTDAGPDKIEIWSTGSVASLLILSFRTGCPGLIAACRRL
jgi:hypothetical protein